MQLAIRASSIVGGMIVPGVIGGLIDSWLGTNFCVLIGIGLGVVLGTVQLLALARRSGNKPGAKKPADDKDPES